MKFLRLAEAVRLHSRILVYENPYVGDFRRVLPLFGIVQLNAYRLHPVGSVPVHHIHFAGCESQNCREQSCRHLQTVSFHRLDFLSGIEKTMRTPLSQM